MISSISFHLPEVKLCDKREDSYQMVWHRPVESTALIRPWDHLAANKSGCQQLCAFDDRSHARRTPSKYLRDERTESGRQMPFPQELIQILVSPDALAVASGRESRIRHNRVDVIAGLAYQDREVECPLVFANLGNS